MSPNAAMARMVPEALKEALYPHLFPDPDDGDPLHTFAILDGAAIPDLLERLYGERPEFICLYRGELQPDIAEVAPYLVRLEPEAPFTDWVLERGWGNHWGIFALARESLRAMRTHFRRFLMVKDEEGARLHFRYYDPRVLRVYLPTCDAEETTALFGPVQRYCLEAADPNVLLQYRHMDGQLMPRRVPLTAAMQ